MISIKIIKDNQKKIRDEVLENLDILLNQIDLEYFEHEKTQWSEANTKEKLKDNYITTGWYSIGLICSGRMLDNSKLYPFTTSLFDKIDLPYKLSLGFTILKCGGFISTHNDPEKIYRYHLCLQAEDNKSEINNKILNVGEEYTIDTSKEHSARNQSDVIDRIHLVVDFATTESQVKHYIKTFGYGGEWEGGWKKNAR